MSTRMEKLTTSPGAVPAPGAGGRARGARQQRPSDGPRAGREGGTNPRPPTVQCPPGGRPPRHPRGGSPPPQPPRRVSERLVDVRRFKVRIRLEDFVAG